MVFFLDTDVFNYALTLEHLKNAFYSANFSQFDFQDAGLPRWARACFEQVAAHEATHVATLTAALGDQATQACTYCLCVFLNGVL